MKKRIVYIVILLLLIFGFKSEKNLTDFTKITDKIFMYNFEVSVGEYYIFLKANNFDAMLMPDTSVFCESDIFKEQLIANTFTKEYFSDKYKDFPIVGITPKQAVEYLKWLKLSNKSFMNVKEIRLPNLNEYYSVLFNDTIKVNFLQNGKCKFLRNNNLDENQSTNICNYLLNQTIVKGGFIQNNSGYLDGYVFLSPVDSYYSKKINHLMGNVSEWVYYNSNIVPIGGNYASKIQYDSNLGNPYYLTWDDEIISSFENINKPSTKIGFRFVLVLN